ncbi:hypothetical protein V5799_024367 [Amblyomma americanum]|uniref:Uncharacterized protein n=1 Tax=Amblyomma americanum TaxID=6943 RepID=A0AAQ4ECR9_AMBAM
MKLSMIYFAAIRSKQHIEDRHGFLHAGMENLCGSAVLTLVIFDGRRFDSLSGLTFGGDQGGLHKRGYGHGEFDEIDHAGWPGFYKRNFDEIDRTGFEGFYKRAVRDE